MPQIAQIPKYLCSSVKSASKRNFHSSGVSHWLITNSLSEISARRRGAIPARVLSDSGAPSNKYSGIRKANANVCGYFVQLIMRPA